MDSLKASHYAVHTPPQLLYKQRLAASNSASSYSSIPPALDLQALQKELQTVASKAAARQKSLENDLAILEDLVRFSTEAASKASNKKSAPKSTPNRKRKRDYVVDSESEFSDDSSVKPTQKASDSSKSKQSSTSGQFAKQPAARVNAKPPKQSSSDPKRRKIDADTFTPIAHEAPVGLQPTETTRQDFPVHPSQVNEDFTKAKTATNQVPIATFYTSIEGYFRPFDEPDLQFLRHEDDNIFPFLIPPLGRPFSETWADEDRGIPATTKAFDLNGTSNASAITVKPVQLTDDPAVNDQLLESTDDIGCGPLTERIMSALVREEVISEDEGKGDDDEEERERAAWKAKSSSNSAGINKDMETVEMEERIRRELKFIGLLGDEEINWGAREDDEVSSSIRTLQRQLREQVFDNAYYKQKLHELCLDQMAYQEYCSLLDDLDRQVESAYLKRNRNSKSKKKKVMLAKAGLSDNAISAMERRKRLLDGIGPIFTPPEKFKCIPRSSVFTDKAEWQKANQEPYA